jgi:hypothetical protein
MLTIFDADGRPLSLADALLDPGSQLLTLAGVESPAVLLDYYFGRGDRRVMFELDGVLVHGTIQTRWAGGERDWWVEIEARSLAGPLPSAPTGAAGPVAEEASASSGGRR